MRRFSHRSTSDEEKGFHDETSKVISCLRRAIEKCYRTPGEDLASTTVKRKKRSHLDQAIKAVESAQRLGFYEDERRDYAVLTKKSLKKALEEVGDIKKISVHFGMSEGTIKRTIRMFRLEFSESIVEIKA